MAEQQTESHEDLLQSALSTSFTPISLTPSASESEPPSEALPSTATEEVAFSEQSKPAQPLVTSEETAKWTEELAEMDRSWKAESAVRRAEIDERNARFEASGGVKSWENLGDLQGPPNPLLSGPKEVEIIEVTPPAASVASTSAEGIPEVKSYPAEPSPADARDLTTGEPEGSKAEAHAAEISEASTQVDQSHLSQSQRWEEIDSHPSLESSFPSISFPSQPESQSDSTSPSHPHTHHHHHHEHSEKDNTHGSREKGRHTAPPPATLAIFDSRLSTRSRLLALTSSLAINLFLPFVNGMMLGFGEIFGRALLARFGWHVPSTPGGAATAVGVSAAPKSRKSEQRANL